MDAQSIKLKAVRKFLNLNQVDMANKLGIKQSYYSALEGGKKAFTQTIINSLISEVGVSPEWWYSDKTDQVDITIGNKILDKNVAKLSHDPAEKVDMREILPLQLDDIIKEKLFYIDFYLQAICFHIANAKGVKPNEAKDLERIIQYIKRLLKTHKADLGIETPGYLELDLMAKARLIKQLDSDIRAILDQIWLITRTLKGITYY